jgi:hypothetical protein
MHVHLPKYMRALTSERCTFDQVDLSACEWASMFHHQYTRFYSMASFSGVHQAGACLKEVVLKICREK